jgi:LysM domain
MFSDQQLKGRLTVGLLSCAAAIAGCSSSGSMSREDSASRPTPVAETAEPVPVDMTATEAAVARADSGDTSAVSEGAPPDSSIINPSAPKSYTVKRGDTLWDISSMFLRDPWLWPEIWYVNNQIANPHLIYPGDVLALAYGADGRPQIRLERGGAARLDPRLRSSPLDGAIPTIPYSAISAFLSRPAVLTKDQVKRSPHIVAFRDNHMIAGTGHEVYVRNLKAEQNARFSVMHVGDPLRDPDTGDVLGYQGIYTATALVTVPGSPAKALLSDSERETLEGDRLLAIDNDVPLNFTPRAPAQDVTGRIMSVIDGVELIGQYQIVVINRGKSHGVDAGSVLAVDTAGAIVRDKHRPGRGALSTGSAFAPKVKLPDERAGTLLVFKAFDRLSYALVVGATNPMRVADVVRNP